MFVGNRRCVSVPINYFRSETQLCSKHNDVYHIKKSSEEKIICFMELNVPICFTSIKPIILNVYSAQPLISSSSCIVFKDFWFAKLFMNRSVQSSHLEQFRAFHFFAHYRKGPVSADRILKVVIFWLKKSQLQPNVKNCSFPVWDELTFDIKTRFL